MNFLDAPQQVEVYFISRNSVVTILQFTTQVWTWIVAMLNFIDKLKIYNVKILAKFVVRFDIKILVKLIFVQSCQNIFVAM